MKFKFSGNPHANPANPAKVGVDTSFQSWESHAKVCESAESLEMIRKDSQSFHKPQSQQIRQDSQDSQLSHRVNAENANFVTTSTELPGKMPDSELRQKVLKQLADNPETKFAYVVDDPDTDPVIVWFGIRDVATCEIAIPMERFDPFEFMLAIKDLAGTA